MKALLFLFVLLLFYAPATQAMELLELEGKDRVANIYTAREIPKYLRSRQCDSYAYQQKFKNTIVNGKILDGSDYAVGTIPGDMERLKKHKICLLVLKKEGMLKGEHKPVNFYEIETFSGTNNDIHVGENHRPMDDGNYELEDGMKFTVKNGLLVSGAP